MGMEVVHDPSTAFSIGIMAIHQVTHRIGPIDWGALVSDCHTTLSRERFKEHEQLAGAVAHLFVSSASGLACCQGQGLGHFADQWFRAFIHTHGRVQGGVRALINLTASI